MRRHQGYLICFRRWLLQMHFVIGNCFLRCSRLGLPASFYLVHPWTRTACIPAVVFGFSPRRTSHLERSASNHSYGYAFCSARPCASLLRSLRENSLPESFSTDRTTCDLQGRRECRYAMEEEPATYRDVGNAGTPWRKNLRMPITP